MWHWTTRTGECPEAVAFTRQPSEPEPVVTEREVVTEAEETEDDHHDAVPEPVITQRFALAG